MPHKLRTILFLPVILMTLLFTPPAADTDTAVLKGADLFVMGEALVMGQGITNDGQYYYTSGSATALRFTALSKIDISTGRHVLTRVSPLPDVCRERGNDHIGGISFYNGKIYAAVEGGDVCKACVAVFDTGLQPTGEVYDLPDDGRFEDGVPWLAVDGETGLLYCSGWSHAKTLSVFDANDGMKPVREIPLTGLGELDRIQGGEFYNGRLYLSCDNQDNARFKRILTVDPASGEVRVLAERDVGGKNTEAEGLTVLPTPDGAFLHVLDYNKAVGIFLRHYALTGNG